MSDVADMRGGDDPTTSRDVVFLYQAPSSPLHLTRFTLFGPDYNDGYGEADGRAPCLVVAPTLSRSHPTARTLSRCQSLASGVSPVTS